MGQFNNQCIRSYWLWCALGELLPGPEGVFCLGKGKARINIVRIVISYATGTVVLRERRD